MPTADIAPSPGVSNWAKLKLATHTTTAFKQTLVKPSARWRAGFTLYGGWPAQEGTTDGKYFNERRSTHDLLAPGEVIQAAAKHVPPPRPSWSARYPAWWGVEEEEPPPPPRAPPLPRYRHNYEDATHAVRRAAATEAYAEPPASPAAPPAPETRSASTQTAAKQAREVAAHSPFMPCMRATDSATAPPPPLTTAPVDQRLYRQIADLDKLFGDEAATSSAHDAE